MEYVFIMALGLMCFFIGFFFGRVTKNRIEMKKKTNVKHTRTSSTERDE